MKCTEAQSCVFSTLHNQHLSGIALHSLVVEFLWRHHRPMSAAAVLTLKTCVYSREKGYIVEDVIDGTGL